MNKKYFFFDIDGTLTNKNPGGQILPSTHETLRKLKNNGHFVAIATGRSECMAKTFAEECHINNMVHDGGNGLTVNGEIVYIKPLDHEKALKIIHECINKGVPLSVAIDNTWNRYSHNDALLKIYQEAGESLPLIVKSDLNYDSLKEIHKIFIGLRPGEEKIINSFSELGYSRYADHYIIIEPDDKVQGIKDMINYLGASFDDVVVFGDGHNDLTMIKAAPMSIAMGNAIDELKENATFTTKRCDDDGIEYACRYFGWID